jgi:hypothetical protein
LRWGCFTTAAGQHENCHDGYHHQQNDRYRYRHLRFFLHRSSLPSSTQLLFLLH